MTRSRTCYLIFFLWYSLLPGCKSLSNIHWPTVLRKYAQYNQDSLCLQSALFLKANMDQPAGEYEMSDSIPLTNDLIEENIEDAVAAWKNLPPETRCTWSIFLEYVLPYKVLNESPSTWRTRARDKFVKFTGGVKRNDQFAIHLLDTINNDIKQWFTFNAHTSPETWMDLLTTKSGDCIAMCRLMAYAGRAHGLPVAIDYCPAWSNINAGPHYWNVLLQNEGKSIPFMGAESNPGTYNPFLLFETSLPESDMSTFKKCAKVFRHTFSVNKQAIRKWIKDDADIPYTLSEDHVVDVTHEYVPVTNISVHVSAGTPQKVAYLCIYNRGQWVPAAWDTINRALRAVFTNIATNQLYLPARFKAGTVTPLQQPFITDGVSVRWLQPEKANKVKMEIKNLSSVEQEQQDMYNHVTEFAWKDFADMQHRLARGKDRKLPQHGHRYTLYYWDKHWVVFAATTCTNGRLVFQEVPSNALYKIVGDNSNGNERIFTYENGKQHWW